MHTRYQSFYRLLIKSEMVNIFMIAHCVDSAVNRLWNKISPTVQKKKKKNLQLWYSYRLAVIIYLMVDMKSSGLGNLYMLYQG